jgi:hypothetical protein
MRKFLAFGALFLAACSGNSATNNAAVSGESDSSGVTALNDTTAIDAATGQAANMAADDNYTFNEEALNSGSNETGSSPKPAAKKSAPSPNDEPDEPGTPGTSTNNSAG